MLYIGHICMAQKKNVDIKWSICPPKKGRKFSTVNTELGVETLSTVPQNDIHNNPFPNENH